MTDYSMPPGASSHLLELIESLGWPLTKASYVAAMHFPLPPDFPLDAEVEARVPEDLPGRMPTSLNEVMFPISPEAMDAADVRIPEPLIEQTMRKFGFSRAKAIEEIKKFGG